MSWFQTTDAKQRLRHYGVRLLTMGALACGFSTAQAQTVLPTDVDNACQFSQSDFNNAAATSMVTLQLPIKNNPTMIGPFYDEQSGLVYVFPPQGPTFASSSNCEFFEWAAQMFLWSTSSVHDGAVPVSGTPNSATPYVFNSEFFYRFSDNQLIPQSADGDDSVAAMSLRHLKPVDAAAAEDSVGQAGEVNGVLLSQGANAASKKSSIVYYGVHTNRVLGYTALAKQQGLVGSEFPSDGKAVCQAITLGILEGYTKLTDVSGYLFNLFCSADESTLEKLAIDADMLLHKSKVNTINIPQLEPAIDYLSMTVELKTSWVEADSVQDKSQYILQKEMVPTYTKTTDSSGKAVWKASGKTVKELAMVGMHVVGTVKGHPEMIWATIEHVNNAPDAAYYYIKSDKQLGSHTPDYSGSAADSTWLFADGSSAAQNAELAVVCTDSKLDICQAGTGAIGSTNVVRSNPWGVKAKADVSSMSTKISTQLISLNNNVLASLKAFNKAKGISGDPRENYYVSGANWGKDGQIPTSFDSASPVVQGSAYLANTTMETFKQDDGCFSCHSAEKSKAGKVDAFSTSHIFESIDKVVK